MSKLKILIDSKHGLGDCVQIIPMLQVIKENYPNCYLAVLVNGEASKELLKLSPIKIDGFYSLNMSKLTIKNFLLLINDIRGQHFDYFVISPITTKWKAKLFALLTGARICVGEQYQNINQYKIDNTVHMVERNLRVLREFCPLPVHKIKPKLKIDISNTNLEIRKPDNGKVIGVCIGGGTASLIGNNKIYPRKWSIQEIKAMIEAILKNGDKVVLFGGQDEVKELKNLMEIIWQQNVLNYLGKTSIQESAILVKQCDLLVGVDTGMQHIADAVGVKTLSVFGPTNPKTHGAYSEKASFIEYQCDCKYCYGTDMYLKCKTRQCLKAINSDMVLNKIFDILGGV